MKRIRIGAGAGYSGDRIEPAVELAECGEIQYLIFECLAERTIAIAQQARARDPQAGFDPLLVDRMEAVLGICARNGIKIVTNMGAANPLAALRQVREVAARLNLRGLKIAAVTGDDVLDAVRRGGFPVEQSDMSAAELGDKLISANAYLGASPIVDALAGGANIVITGRVADPSLTLAPLMYEFGWAEQDWRRLGFGTMIGHLLECAGHITGGYFADPGYKDAPNLARLGYPIAEVSEDGTAVITKVAGSGGRVTLAACKEQLLYEIHDPAAYLTPDVIADFTDARFTELGADRIRVTGGRGRPRPETLKISLGCLDGYIGEGQISYAGPGAVNRARLAIEIVEQRLKLTHVDYQEIKFDLIGVDALHGSRLSVSAHEPYEVRVRVAGRTANMREALRIGNEVETLYMNGPAGGGGVTKSVREVVAVLPMLMPRQQVETRVHYEVIQ